MPDIKKKRRSGELARQIKRQEKIANTPIRRSSAKSRVPRAPRY